MRTKKKKKKKGKKGKGDQLVVLFRSELWK